MTTHADHATPGWEDADVIWVPVPFSAAEYRRLRKRRWSTPDGVTWEVIRDRLGLQDRPVRYVKGTHAGLHEGERLWVTQAPSLTVEDDADEVDA